MFLQHKQQRQQPIPHFKPFLIHIIAINQPNKCSIKSLHPCLWLQIEKFDTLQRYNTCHLSESPKSLPKNSIARICWEIHLSHYYIIPVIHNNYFTTIPFAAHAQSQKRNIKTSPINTVSCTISLSPISLLAKSFPKQNSVVINISSQYTVTMP